MKFFRPNLQVLSSRFLPPPVRFSPAYELFCRALIVIWAAAYAVGHLLLWTHLFLGFIVDNYAHFTESLVWMAGLTVAFFLLFPLATYRPAGWHADPAGRFKYRYWDGSEWTTFVSSGRETETDVPEWSPDPTGRFAYRFWEGNRWSNKVSDGAKVRNSWFRSQWNLGIAVVAMIFGWWGNFTSGTSEVVPFSHVVSQVVGAATVPALVAIFIVCRPHRLKSPPVTAGSDEDTTVPSR